MVDTGKIDDNYQRCRIQTLTALKGSYGWTSTAYRVSQSVSGRHIDFILPICGRGFVEIQAGLLDIDGGSGTATVEVLADGQSIFSGSIIYCQKKFSTQSVNIKKEVRVRFTYITNNYTDMSLVSINVWRLPKASILPAPSIVSGKTVAVLGASWTQFPTSGNGLSIYPEYNVIVTRPDETEGDGYGYFPKELARVTGATVDDWGKSGMRVDNWGLEIIDTILSTKHYDYIIIVFWLNDFNGGVSLETWADNLVKLIERCKSACVKPIVLTPCRTNSNSSYAGWYQRVLRGEGLM